MPTPKFLINFYLTVTKHYSDSDIYYENVLYRGKLLNAPSIAKALDEDRNNPTYSLTLELSNADGEFSDLDYGGEEFRGKSLKIIKYDPTATSALGYGEGGYGEGGYGGAIPDPRFELWAKVTRPNILEKSAFFDILIGDPDALQTILPKKVLEDSDFASDRPTAAYRPSHDLGKPYNILIGHAKKVPCLALYFDPVADTYDFLIGYGTIRSTDSNKANTVNVYREKKLISSDQYTVYDGSQGSPYSGYAFIRFTNNQYVFGNSGTFYEIEIDAYGLEMGGTNEQRNGVSIIENLLSNSTWGLGETVNTESFRVAANYVSNFLFDGVISSQRKAQDIIKEFRDGCFVDKLDKDESGEWVIEVDHYQGWVDASFGYKDRFYENIMEIITNEVLPSNEAIKDVCIKYGYNPWTSEYKYVTKRVVNAFGEDKIIECNFIRNHETADRIACRIQKSNQEKKRRMELLVSLKGESLKEGSIIDVDIVPLKIDGWFKIPKIDRELTKFPLTIQSYSSSIYTYTPGTLPSDGISDEAPDYSSTEPEAPTGLTLVSSGTYQSTDGTTIAFAELSAIRPSVNFSKMIFGDKKNGETIPYSYGDGNLDSGTTWKGTLRGLIPGVSYDLCARAENSFGLKSDLTVLSAQVAPGDTTAPATPTGLAATAKIQSVVLTCNENTEADVELYEVYRHTSDVSGSATKIATIKASKEATGTVSYTDKNVLYIAYYYWLKAVDRSKNRSAFTASVNATPLKAVNGDVNFPYAGGQSQGGPPVVLNNSNLETGYTIDVYGDIYMRNGQDIHFKTNGTEVGAIYGTGSSLTIGGSGNFGVSMIGIIAISSQGGNNVSLITNGGNIRLDGAKLCIENISSGSTPGTVINKLEVFDLLGNSKGFLALYNSIT